MGSQTLELKWANHKANMTLELQELYLNDALLDVTIACGDFSLKAHKTVLSASSTFFRKLFIDNPCKHPILIMTDVDFEDLKTIVEFMYQGEIHVSREKLSQFLKTADRLKIKGLTCIEDMNINPSKQSEVNIDPNYSDDTWERASTPSELQDTTGTANEHNSSRKLTECVQNETNKDIQVVKLEEDPSQPDNNSCMYWQNEGFDRTSGLLPDCSLPGQPAVSLQLSTSSMSCQPVGATLPHQLSTFPISSQLSTTTSLQKLSTPSASHQHRVPLSSENLTYPEIQTSSGTLAQMQDENTGKEVTPVNLYQSEVQSSLIVPSSSKSLDIVETQSSQSSSQASKTDNGVFSVEEIAFTSLGVNIHTSENLVHAKSEKSYFNCRFCKKSFKAFNMLKNHLEFHSKLGRFICEACNIRFRFKYALLAHQRIHTGEKPFICGVCSKGFREMRVLRQHERTHTGEKPFECGMCGKRFTQLSTLRQHERIHTGEKPFECQMCNKGFAQLSSLRQHERTHTNKKPFHCEVCNKRFRVLSNLREHERMHLVKKCFECKVCKKEFKQLGNLRQHERIHTDEKPVQCKTCYMQFAHSFALQCHESKHTREDPFECAFVARDLYH